MDHLLASRQSYYSSAVILIILMHIAGFLGLQSSFTRPWFESLVPFNLLVCGFLILVFQQEINARFVWVAMLIILLGFTIECIGVKTKVIFGDYYYQTALGWKFFEVPIIIGLNWFVLVSSTALIGDRLSRHLGSKVLLGAVLMVGMDILIEPVAIRHHFWAWSQAEVPLQNYLAWFIISIGMLLIYHLADFDKENKIALPIFLAQAGFFLAHNLTYL
ncbi:MAG: carotenoid biosynthesis protein [Microscillaceae bacterium]|nr:carotenoid biosynthesis protein [Microscillaceae bacterium]